MKKVLLLTIALLALAGATSAATAQKTDATVSITAAGFKPDTVFIDRGESVKWTNNDSTDHQVVLEAPTVFSPVLHPGQSFSYRFDAAQTRSYHDGKKPSMTGLVQVSGASVTLTVSRLQVVYGSGVQVAGGIGPHGGNQLVTIHISHTGASNRRSRS